MQINVRAYLFGLLCSFVGGYFLGRDFPNAVNIFMGVLIWGTGFYLVHKSVSRI